MLVRAVVPIRTGSIASNLPGPRPGIFFDLGSADFMSATEPCFRSRCALAPRCSLYAKLPTFPRHRRVSEASQRLNLRLKPTVEYLNGRVLRRFAEDRCGDAADLVSNAPGTDTSSFMLSAQYYLDHSAGIKLRI